MAGRKSAANQTNVRATDDGADVKKIQIKADMKQRSQGVTLRAM